MITGRSALSVGDGFGVTKDVTGMESIFDYTPTHQLGFLKL